MTAELVPQPLFDQAVAWRRHGEKEQRVIPFAEAKATLLAEILGRKDWRVKE